METVSSAVLGELISRSISFLLKKFSNHMAPPSMEEGLQGLQQVLLRVRIVVEEEEGRGITNQAMLQQLKILRYEMYRGYYVLDNCRYRVSNDEASRHSFTLSKFNPAKRFCFTEESKKSRKELQEMLHGLTVLVANTKELVAFLKSYPRMYRQPYSMSLFMDKCMFARQMEMERVTSFLLRMEPHGSDELGVLPIVGVARVGKSTLAEHVCIDERVRNHFSRIVFFTENDLKDGKVTNLSGGGVIKFHNDAPAGNERLLVIVELAGDVDEDVWRRVCVTSGACIGNGSRIIITSRSDKIAKLGTTQALELKHLPREAYWYFFKVLTFGSMDPEEHPRLASTAMEIAMELNGTFLGGNVVASLLRANVNTKFWCQVLVFLREYIRKHQFLSGEHPMGLWQKNRHVYIPKIAKTTEDCLVYDQHESSVGVAQDNVPKITLQEVLSGSAKPHGEFEVLAWQSHIPPCYSYTFCCKAPRPKHLIGSKRKSIKKTSI